MFATAEMKEQASLAELLKLVLAIPENQPVFATPSFQPWLDPDVSEAWPPSRHHGGLWLVDTRDRAGRGLVQAWRRGHAQHSFDAALILCGSGPEGSALRRFLWRLRHPGMKRVAERHAAACLPSSHEVHRLAFTDGMEVPAEFDVAGDPHSTGAALLLSRDNPFTGPIWHRFGERLGDRDIEIESFQLRIRGAAVAIVRARGHRFVVRIVPACRLQETVLRNHAALVRIRGALAGHAALLRLIPEPLFVEKLGSTAVLCESFLPGALAWKVASGAMGRRIHENAVEYLRALRAATENADPRWGARVVDDLIAEDVARLEKADFASDAVRGMLRDELRAAVRVLEGVNLRLHTSHGDFGYGNILVDVHTAELTGVIDWDTARTADFPGMDRVNLEIQARRTTRQESFHDAARAVWHLRSAHEALEGSGGPQRERALFGLAVCRFIMRSFNYPEIYRRDAADFTRALMWLRTVAE